MYILNHMLCVYCIQLSKNVWKGTTKSLNSYPCLQCSFVAIFYWNNHKIIYFPKHQVKYKIFFSAHKINIYQILQVKRTLSLLLFYIVLLYLVMCIMQIIVPLRLFGGLTSVNKRETPSVLFSLL